MSFNAKEAAQRLFDIADAIEKQAAKSSFFVCDSCNHTASLESINSLRTKYASENGIESVSNVTIDDTISCKACGGDMKYAATEDSEKFFVEAGEDSDTDLDDVDIDIDIEEDAEDAQPKEKEDSEDAEVEDSPESEEDSEDEAEEEDDSEDKEEKPKKRTTKDKEDSDGKVETKEKPEAQFGEDDKKKSKTAFDMAVDRYSNF
jgi:hypothetical protein